VGSDDEVAERVFPQPDDGLSDDERAAIEDARRMERNSSMVRQGRRIGGLPGAMMAGAMAALREIYEGPAKEEIPIVSETPDEPHDVDRDGLRWEFDDVSAETPPQPRTAPVVARRRSRDRRRVTGSG
jgi:hypothetical protein